MRPVLFSIGDYDVLTSPFVTILSALAAFFYFRRYRDYIRISLEDFWTLVLLLLVSAFVGAIAVYFFLYNGGYANNLRFLSQHRITPGGSLYGALWAGVLCAYLFCRSIKADFRRVADLLGVMAPLTLAIKRLGCLLQGCCYGKPTHLPWGIVFRDPRCRIPKAWLGTPLHPTQLYESLAALLIFLLVHFVVFRKIRAGRLKPGSAFTAFLLLYSVFRFLLEPIRGGEDGLLGLFGLNTSQLLAIASMAVACLLHLRWRAVGQARS